MSLLKRRILTIIFVLLFLGLAPFIIFYAVGNILGEGWSILPTGGIFIRSMESGSELYVNERPKITVNFFSRNSFIKNLRPGIYSIVVKKEGYNDWVNKIKVYGNLVSESNVFMLPKDIVVTEIKKFLEIDNKIEATTTIKQEPKINPDYQMVSSFFDKKFLLESSILIVSTTTGTTTKYTLGTEENPIKKGYLSIWSVGQTAYIDWNGKNDSSSKIFCNENGEGLVCQNRLKVYTFETAIRSIDFFPGEVEVIIVSVGDKIYAIEAEDNPDKKLQVIFNGHEPDFRVFNNVIYIKDSGSFSKVEI